MEEKFKQHGAFSWFELSTTDTEAATRFYTDLFGWSVEKMPMDDMTYTVVKSGEESIGGIMPLAPEPPGVPPHWGIYVTVDDVDAVARKAQELGAKILCPLTDVPRVGRFCTFQDPQGAVISAITYEDME